MMIPENTRNITGAILAGGRSTRMGKPKEGMILCDKRPMIEHIIDAMRPLCSRIAIVGACGGYQIPEDNQLLHIQDLHPGHGPLSALEALLASGLEHRYLVTSCDQPLLTVETLARLVGSPGEGLTFFRSESGQELDPFPGIYPERLLPMVEKAIRHEHYAIRRLVRENPVHWVTLPNNQLRDLVNVNTPETLAELEGYFARGECQNRMGAPYHD